MELCCFSNSLERLSYIIKYAKINKNIVIASNKDHLSSIYRCLKGFDVQCYYGNSNIIVERFLCVIDLVASYSHVKLLTILSFLFRYSEEMQAFETEVLRPHGSVIKDLSSVLKFCDTEKFESIVNIIENLVLLQKEQVNIVPLFCDIIAKILPNNAEEILRSLINHNEISVSRNLDDLKREIMKLSIINKTIDEAITLLDFESISGLDINKKIVAVIDNVLELDLNKFIPDVVFVNFEIKSEVENFLTINNCKYELRKDMNSNIDIFDIQNNALEYQPILIEMTHDPINKLPSVISPTGIQLLNANPYAFWVRYALKFKSLESLNEHESSKDIGLCIHASLEQFALYVKRNKIVKRDVLIGIISRVSIDSLGYDITKSNLWIDRINNIVNKVVNLELEALNNKDVQVEHSVYGVIGDVKVRAIADRLEVDNQTGMASIYDFKTGSTLPTLSQELNGTKTQLAIIAILLEQNNINTEKISYVNCSGIRNATDVIIEGSKLIELIDHVKIELSNTIKYYYLDKMPFKYKKTSIYSQYQSDFELDLFARERRYYVFNA